MEHKASEDTGTHEFKLINGSGTAVSLSKMIGYETWAPYTMIITASKIELSIGGVTSNITLSSGVNGLLVSRIYVYNGSGDNGTSVYVKDLLCGFL